MDSLPPPKIALLVHAPSPAPLFSALATLLEPSESLKTKLAPEVHEELARRRAAGEALPNSYGALLTLTQETINKWDVTDQQDFIASHPRIGETKQLSKLSEKEQGDQAATGVQTPGHVLKRLIVLNNLYEASYPGLRFITFVNGRSRAEIIPEFESIIGVSLPEPSPDTPEPSQSALMQKITVRVQGSSAWRNELARARQAVFDIARARLNALGIE